MKMLWAYNKNVKLFKTKSGQLWLNIYRNGMFLKYKLSKNQKRKWFRYGKHPKDFNIDKFLAGTVYKTTPKKVDKFVKQKPYSFTKINGDKCIVRSSTQTRNDPELSFKQENRLNKSVIEKVKRDVENNIVL